MDVADEGEEKGRCVFGDGVGGVGRDADDGEPGIPGGAEIDVVVARAAHGENLDASRDEAFDDCAVDFGVHEGAGGIGPVCKREGRGGEARFEVADVVAAVVEAVERFAVVGLGVEKGEFFHGMFLSVRDTAGRPLLPAFCQERTVLSF